MKSFVKKNNWLTRDITDFGWGNGYVTIPEGHPLHGKDYYTIHRLIPELKINGGLTFSDFADTLKWDELPEESQGSWVVGFDTAHSWDTLEMWSEENVMQEAERLKEQLINYNS